MATQFKFRSAKAAGLEQHGEFKQDCASSDEPSVQGDREILCMTTWPNSNMIHICLEAISS